MKMKVRRCQGWGLDRAFTVLVVVQCRLPASEDGVRCAAHKEQKPVEWMEKPP